ncbi:MAG: gliding motility-associated C-terminal domain-containing protein [Crocinitomicaceae bacterium]|nr:gliding motility-associated C-terminal domain-containing protein [Crocinitomicaceae bacterium]
MRDKDEIAEIFKKGLDGYQAKVDPAIWSSIQSSLGSATTSTAASVASTGLSVGKTIIGVAAAVVATTATVFLVVNSNEETTTIQRQEFVKEEAVDDNASSDSDDKVNLNEGIITNESFDISDDATVINDFDEDIANQVVNNNELDKSNNNKVNLEHDELKPSVSLSEDLGVTPVINKEKHTSDVNIFEEPKEEESLYEIALHVSISKEKISAQHFKFYAQTVENANISWDFGDGYFSKGVEVEHVFNEPGNYDVFVTVTKDNQEVTEHIEIAVLAYGSIDHLPNVFSPDGDGINDELFISASHIKDFQITVFDSKNNVVYQSNDVNFRWNGVDIRSGLPVPTGSYYYIITASDEQGNNINKFQHLTIKR